MRTRADHVLDGPVPARVTAGSQAPRRAAGATLVAGVVASIGLSASPAAALTSSAALTAAGPAAGTIFVANAGGEPDGSNGTGPGSITVYRPGATGDTSPEVVVTKGIDGPNGIAVDASGDLWVANDAGNIVEYKRAQLAKASPAPSVTIQGGAFGLAFDPSGNLWVSAAEVVEYSKAELAKSGSPSPVFTLDENDCSIAFDSSGDLWEGSHGSTVSEWTRAELSKVSVLSPAPKEVIISDDLNTPCKPAFDGSGDLWVGNYNANTVVEFTQAQIAKPGSPDANVTISSSKYAAPGDVAVSSSGNLWVPYFGSDVLTSGKGSVAIWAVAEFAKGQLARSGSPKPAVTITGPDTGLNNPWAVAIEP